MGLKQLAPAADRVVTLAAARLQCSIAADVTEFDAELARYIDAATRHVEQVTGRALGMQQWLLTLWDFEDAIALPLGPVIQVDSVEYLDADRRLQLLDPSIYMVDLTAAPQLLVRDPDQSWPDVADVREAVRVTFSTGYDAVPPDLVQAILMLVSWWFTQREAVNVGNIVSEVPLGFAALVQPYKKMVL
ncbi:head-tail connector protein [Novosphingobium sp.]|uniref:head-tail connector protein n=1 Tax=Novosphingobium sp. TaxID=1874826 RepID=UPI0038BAD226